MSRHVLAAAGRPADPRWTAAWSYRAARQGHGGEPGCRGGDV